MAATSCWRAISAPPRATSAASSDGHCHDRSHDRGHHRGHDRGSAGPDRAGHRPRQRDRRAVALAARDAGAEVVAAGRDQRALAGSYGGEPGITTESVDLNDEASIAALGKRLGTVVHVVSTASARARGRIADLDRADDIARGVLFAMTSTFLTGQTLHIDGGEPLT
jgi:hypothetical protein